MAGAGWRTYSGSLYPQNQPCPWDAHLGQLTYVLSGQFSASAEKGLRHTPSWDFFFFFQDDFALVTTICVGLRVISVLFCLMQSVSIVFLPRKLLEAEVRSW